MAKFKNLDSNDRLHILVPKGVKEGMKEYLFGRFENDNISHYVKTLIELDLMGKVEWGADVGKFPLLREMATAKKK